MRKRRSSGRVTLQDVADYVGVGVMTVSRAMRTPERVSAKIRGEVEKAAQTLGYEAVQSDGGTGRDPERVTLRDVARRAGVGQMTVSRALRDPTLVSEPSLQRVIQAVRELGYQSCQSNLARDPASPHVVALLLPIAYDRSSARFVQALQQALLHQPFQLIVACPQQGESALLETLLQYPPAAIVLFATPLSVKARALLATRAVPILTLTAAGEAGPNYTIRIAAGDAAERLTLSLLEKGYRRIAFIGAQADSALHKQQLTGWHRAMLAHYQNADLSLAVPDAPTLSFGRFAFSQLLQNQPEMDAVICSHEEVALGVLAECHRRLLKVPFDMAVACLEGSPECDHLSPPLTSVRLNYEQLGQRVAECLKTLTTRTPFAGEESIAYTLDVRASSHATK